MTDDPDHDASQGGGPDRAPRDGPAPRLPRPAARILDALFGLCLLVGPITSILVADRSPDPSYLGVIAAMLIPLAAVWAYWRSGRGGLVSAIAFAVLAALVSLFGNLLVLMLPALIVITLAVGRAASLALAFGLLTIGTLLGLLVPGGGPDSLRELPLNALLLALGLTIAWFVRAYAAELTRSERLAADVLRNREAERELVLAEERARAARELHDGLGHRLTMITMALDFAERARERQPDRADAAISAARRVAGQTLTEMRRWVRALAPATRPGATGANALEAIADSFRGTGLTVTVQATGAAAAPSEEIELFARRFVQEGLTNALRHGTPDRVSIGWRRRPGSLELSVIDESARAAAEPASPEPCSPIPGFGLRSLADRAGELGGRIDATPIERGFALRARLPLPTPGDSR